MSKKNIAIIGGGPSALISAYYLSPSYDVTIYEKEKTIGQKFLVAGKGGFNITNSLIGKELAIKYTPQNFLNHAILNFDSTAVRKWLDDLGIKTFIGTSGRVYVDKKIKPFEVLNKIRTSLELKKVRILTNSKFSGFDDENKPMVSSNDGKLVLNADFYIFALGGASWSITGSNGKWLNHFANIGVDTKLFEPSNCGVNIKWPEDFIKYHTGKPLKNIIVHTKNIISTGEAVITNNGLEGNSIYSVIPEVRESLKNGKSEIFVDLKPDNTKEELLNKLKNIDINSNNYKSVLNLTSVQLALVKSQLSKEEFHSPNNFVTKLKALKLKVISLRPIEEAISTVGGICTTELTTNFSLKKYPNIFTIGEMVDWDAPTGGFLLQGCFSMGVHVANSLQEKIK